MIIEECLFPNNILNMKKTYLFMQRNIDNLGGKGEEW